MSHVSPRAAEFDAERAALALAEERSERHLKQDKRSARQRGVFATGRVFLGLLFVGSAIEKLADYSGTVAAMMEMAIDVRPFLPFAIGVELAAGAMIVLGLKARWAASGLVAYLIVGTFLEHLDLTLDFGRAIALGNMGLIGGLLMVAAHGSGPLSLDHLIARRRAASYHRAHRYGPSSAIGAAGAPLSMPRVTPAAAELLRVPLGGRCRSARAGLYRSGP